MESGQRGKTSNKKKAGYKVEQFLEDLQKTIDVTIKSPAKEEYETVVKCKHGNLAWVNQRKDWISVSIFPPISLDKNNGSWKTIKVKTAKDGLKLISELKDRIDLFKPRKTTQGS